MTKLALNYPAPIPIGHRIEVTWFEDMRPEKKRDRVTWSAPHSLPAVRDLDTGITYMNHAHASYDLNGGNTFRPNDYPFAPLGTLPVREMWRARVTACALVMVEMLESQHTVLEIEPLPAGE